MPARRRVHARVARGAPQAGQREHPDRLARRLLGPPGLEGPVRAHDRVAAPARLCGSHGEARRCRPRGRVHPADDRRRASGVRRQRQACGRVCPGPAPARRSPAAGRQDGCQREHDHDLDGPAQASRGLDRPWRAGRGRAQLGRHRRRERGQDAQARPRGACGGRGKRERRRRHDRAHHPRGRRARACVGRRVRAGSQHGRGAGRGRCAALERTCSGCAGPLPHAHLRQGDAAIRTAVTRRIRPRPHLPRHDRAAAGRAERGHGRGRPAPLLGR